MLNHHIPVRGQVDWDGAEYKGRCTHCGVKIVRISQGEWRKRRRQ